MFIIPDKAYNRRQFQNRFARMAWHYNCCPVKVNLTEIWITIMNLEAKITSSAVNWKTEPYADFNQKKMENLYYIQKLLPFLKENGTGKKTANDSWIINIFSYATSTFGEES